MCGIVGFLGPWRRDLLADMVASLRHRGPDGTGMVHEAEAGIGLGHTRLSIIDLTQAARQPMESPCGRYVLTFNGEIYNYRDLRGELEQAGVRFRSSGDTEVLLQVLIRWGRDGLNRLNGIFAFALWDRQDRTLFLARDHLGVKPLYYAELAKGFLFGSELKSLALCPDLPRDIDPTAVANHLGFVWSAGEETMLRSVRKLRPGHCMTVGPWGSRIEAYYRSDLPDPSERLQTRRPEELTALVDRVVADQMVADVKVGALLSGGLDSSAIVAAMGRVVPPGQITAFCAGVSKSDGMADNFGDDQAHAHKVARSLGIELIDVPTEPDMLDELQEMVWGLDEPTPDFSALQVRLLAAEARRQGIKVLLSGTGGDDLFTGYGRHTVALLFHRLRALPGARFGLSRILANASVTSLRGRRLRRIGQLLRLPEDDMLIESMSYAELSGRHRLALLAPDIGAELPDDGIPAALRSRLGESRGLHPVTRLLDLELGGFLPDLNLNYADKMAMQAGVELRVPLLDTRLVSFAMSLPVADKIDLRATKKIFRASQQERLSDAVLKRPKQGLGVPVRAWLAGPARAVMEELTSTATLKARGLFDAGAVARLRRDFLDRRLDAAFTLFAMMAVEAWCRRLDSTGEAYIAGEAGGDAGRRVQFSS